jgi:hypothetical protein
MQFTAHIFGDSMFIASKSGFLLGIVGLLATFVVENSTTILISEFTLIFPKLFFGLLVMMGGINIGRQLYRAGEGVVSSLVLIVVAIAFVLMHDLVPALDYERRLPIIGLQAMVWFALLAGIGSHFDLTGAKSANKEAVDDKS